MNQKQLAVLTVVGALLLLATWTWVNRWGSGGNTALSRTDVPSSPASTGSSPKTLPEEPSSGGVVTEGGRSGQVAAETDAPALAYERADVFLAEYWGPRWPELREASLEVWPQYEDYFAWALTSEQVPPPIESVSDELLTDLLHEFDEGHLPTLRRSILIDAWELPLTDGFLAKRMGTAEGTLSSDVLTRATDAYVHHQFEIDAALKEFRERCHWAFRDKFLKRDYEAYPILQLNDPNRWGADGYPGHDAVTSGGKAGWIVILPLLRGEYPRVSELRSELEGLGAAREREIGAIVEQ